MDLHWTPLDQHITSILVLRIDWIQVARVDPRGDGTFRSEVARQRRDWRRRLSVVAPSQAAACRWAERWTRAHLEEILEDLPQRVAGATVWPAHNRPAEGWG